ncbi:MAG: hypothetical protein ABUT20_17635 [Bacteroidota bacterium]
MMRLIIRNTLMVLSLLLASVHFSSAQQISDGKENEPPVKQDNIPYRIVTSGKQITVKSSKDIKNIMIWTASGHRILEQKNVNTSNFNFRISVDEKIFFIMLQLVDGKVYSKKIGI